MHLVGLLLALLLHAPNRLRLCETDVSNSDHNEFEKVPSQGPVV